MDQGDKVAGSVDRVLNQRVTLWQGGVGLVGGCEMRLDRGEEVDWIWIPRKIR